MYSVETEITFEAAHRLYDVNTYSEDCSDNLHGHTYHVIARIGRKTYNDAQMVIDFKLLKEVLYNTIEKKYDHSSILRDVDPVTPTIQQFCKKVNIVHDNPTAEWMSEEFYRTLSEALHEVDDQLHVLSLSVQETENNIATYIPET